MRRVSISKLGFWFCLITSIGLFVAGFYIPPRGVIDGSVLSACGILLGFATLAQLPDIVSGRHFTMTHGQTSVTLSGEKSKCPKSFDETMDSMSGE